MQQSIVQHTLQKIIYNLQSHLYKSMALLNAQYQLLEKSPHYALNLPMKIILTLSPYYKTFLNIDIFTYFLVEFFAYCFCPSGFPIRFYCKLPAMLHLTNNHTSYTQSRSFGLNPSHWKDLLNKYWSASVNVIGMTM